MITYHLEPWAVYRRDCDALWREHYAEIARDKARMPMRPDETMFSALDALGQLQVLTARSDGEMIGYQVSIVRPHPHYADVLCGFEDSYFLQAGHRRGMTGVRLIKESLKHMKARGVKKVFFHTKEFKDLGRIFEFLGFHKSDTVYAKWIAD